MSIFYIKRNSLELFHHGIKGQQWGVRNGPPYPIEDKVLRKGTKVNSVSGYRSSKKYKNSTQNTYLKSLKRKNTAVGVLAIASNPLNIPNVSKYLKNLNEAIKNNEELTKEAQNKIYVYNPDDSHDSKIYTGPFANYLRLGKGIKSVYEHKYETVKDLKMPNSTERFEAFKELANSNKGLFDAEMSRGLKILFYAGQKGACDIVSKRQAKNNPLDFGNLKTKEDYRDAFTIFNSLMENPAGQKITKEYINKLSKQFDAMVDDNNVNVYNDSHDPIIIFNAAVNLIQRENPSKLKVKDIIANTQEIDNYMRDKYGTGALL